MSCEYCEVNKDIWLSQEFQMLGGEWVFCQFCGRPLTKPEAISLEQLRGMDGEWVWVRNIEHDINVGWMLVMVSRQTVSNSIGYLRFEDYEKTWLAYTNNLEREDRDSIYPAKETKTQCDICPHDFPMCMEFEYECPKINTHKPEREGEI